MLEKLHFLPVLHVNADDVEAVVHAVRFALDFRMEFKRDVFIDLLGYRKYGHNEGDEPRFTQPKLYKAIAKHKNPRDIYAEKLIAEGIIDRDYIKQSEQNYKASLESELEDSRKEDKTVITPFMQEAWTNFSRARADHMLEVVDTTYPKEKLKHIAGVISTYQPTKNLFVRLNDWFNLDKQCLIKIN